MKIKLAVFLVIFVAIGGSAFGQGVRFSSQVSQQGTVGTSTNVVTLPTNPVVNFCNHPANATPCTNKATTYSDVTLGTPCSTSTQIVLDATTSCVANPDSQNNWGVWVAPGQYDYTITIGASNFGPFFVTAALGPNAAGNTIVTGDVYFHSGRPWIDVRAFGAKCDGVTNDTAAVQAAINFGASVGSDVIIPPNSTCLANVTVTQPGIRLRGANGAAAGLGLGHQTSILKTAVAGTSPVLSIAPASLALGFGVRDLTFVGNGSGASDQGININGNAARIFIENVSFDTFAQEAIFQASGTGTPITITDSFVQNALLSRTRGSRTGTIHLSGTDAILKNVEATTSESGITNAAHNNCAIFIDGAHFFLEEVTGEISEAGICISGNGAVGRATLSTGELNWGEGWIIQGTSSVYSANTSLNNSQATSGTYDAWLVSGGQNEFSSNLAESTVANLHRYGYNDSIASDSNKNSYVNNYSIGHALAPGWLTAGFAGSNVQFTQGPPITIPAATTTPNVAQATFISFAQATPLTLTNFINGLNGQQILLQGNANITLANNATIATANGLALTLEGSKVYRFTLLGTQWFQDGTENVFAGKSFAGGIGQGTGFKHQRFVGNLGGTCPTGGAVGNACTSANLNWTNAFADNNYTVSCSLVGAMTGQPHIVSATYQAAGAGITLTIAADTAVAANVAPTGLVDCVATHD